jgi:hypothetical protein
VRASPPGSGRTCWTPAPLEPLDGGTATRISVHVDIPEDKGDYLDPEREAITLSLSRLATLASTPTTSRGPGEK